jgi:hypothetical protein
MSQEPSIITRRRGAGLLPGMPAARREPTQEPAQLPADPASRRPRKTVNEPRAATPHQRPAAAPALQAPPRRREPGRPTTLRLPEPLHRRYRRLVRSLDAAGVETDLTELVHTLLHHNPATPTDARALIRRWRAVLDVDPERAIDHPYLNTGSHTTTLRLAPPLRDRTRDLLAELEDLGFRTSLNEIIAASMHFGPHTAEDARQLIDQHRGSSA